MVTTPKMTEAERERMERDRLDRLNTLRRQYASRNGVHPSQVKLSDLDLDEDGPAPDQTPGSPPRGGSKSARILEAARRLAGTDSPRSRIGGRISEVERGLRA